MMLLSAPREPVTRGAISGAPVKSAELLVVTADAVVETGVPIEPLVSDKDSDFSRVLTSK